MKRILLALTMVGFLLPLAPPAQADPEVSLNLFYDNLSPYGSWIELGDYGYCFQPAVAVDNSDWRPYADGYWAYTDAGWTWVSYEDFGWATYHYGRWANLDDYGWVWVPGYEWGPAWVSWRTGGDYVGWAPLLAEPGGVVYEGRAITGAVDVTFGIGPLYYNFVDIRYIGEPVLRGHIIEPRRNVTIINRTVNVTNITYNNTFVINNGPDIGRLNQYSNKPIQRLKLQRESTGDFGGRRGNLNRVNGNELVVAAPAVQRSQQKLAPKQVKAKVEKPRIDKGWQGVNNRQQVEAEMTRENAQNVPPPSFTPPKNRKAEAPATANEPNARTNAGNAAEARRNMRPNGNPESADQGNQPNAQERRRVNAERGQNARAASPDGAPEQPPEARQGERLPAGERPAENAAQPRPRRAQPADENQPNEQAAQPDRPERRLPQPQSEPENIRRARANPAESQLPDRVRRPERAPQQEPQAQQPLRRPEGAQPSQANRRPQQTRPPQEQGQGPRSQAPAEERKGKKMKPGAEPTP